MNRQEMHQQLDHELERVKVSPRLRCSTLRAVQGKDEIVMKRKVSTALVLAIIAVLLASVALAATSKWGMQQFWQQYQNAYVPDNAGDYIQTDVHELGGNDVTILLRELYYDGTEVYATVDVTPTDKDTLLIPEFLSMADGWGNLTKTEDSTPILTRWQESGKKRVLAIGAYCRDENETDDITGNVDAVLNEEGVLTFSLEARYDTCKAERLGRFEFTLITYSDPDQGEAGRDADWKAKITLSAPLKAEQEARRLVCQTPQEYESIGVRVESITMEITPMNIRASVTYTVTDEALFATQGRDMWFEFIDPDSTETAPYKQRLKSGVDTEGWRSEDGTGHYTQVESLGVNEIHESYTLRAFDSGTKERFEAHTFIMQEE